MTIIDDALHHYLDEHQAPTDRAPGGFHAHVAA